MAEPRNRPTQDPVEDLLADVVALEDADQGPAIDALCREHPELAGAIREHYAIYRQLLEGEAPAGGDRFGDYELIRPLGSGGMGLVWLARQRREGTDRTVALKMIRGGGLRSPEARERFRREARAAFRIEHAAICPVYDVGEIDGTPYIAMRHVPGRTLADWITEARAAGRGIELPGTGSTATDRSGSRDTRITTSGRPLDGILALMETVARALHAAHEVAIVHRDVKPGNIMVTPAGEPVLLDFGLVRDADDESSLTLSGQPLGTPAYMAPEQISPRGRVVDRTVDVYGLGATLYECVTLQPPFRAETREGLYRKILEEDPRPARRIVRSLPKDLDAILETALRKEPERRYRTMLDFAEDLRALRRLEPVRARAAGPITRATLWIRRNPFASAVLAMLVLALTFAIVQEREAERRAEEARRARDRAERGFALARGAVEEIVLTARDLLRDVPRVQPVRSALLDSALEFHEQLALDLGDDPEVLGDVGRAWEAVATLRIELGRLDEAEVAVERAEAATRAHLERTGTTDARRAAAAVAALRGMYARARGDLDGARKSFETSAERYRELRSVAPESAADDQNLCRALVALASVLHDGGRAEEAMTRLEEADAAVDRAQSHGLEPVRVLEGRSRVATLRGKMERDLQRFDEADREFERAIVALRALVSREASDRTHRMDLASTLLARGRMRAREGRYEDGLADVEEAITLLDRLTRDFPESATYAANLATAWNNRYVFLSRLGRRDDANASLQEARDLLEQVLAATPSAHEGAADLAAVVFNLGHVARRNEGPAAGLVHYEHALELLQRMSAAQPDNLELTRRVASAAEAAAISNLLLERPERAEPLLAIARRCTEALLERAPDDPRVLRDLGRLRFNEGARAFEDGRFEDAASILSACLELRTRLADAAPSNLRFQYDELLVRARLAVVLLEVDPDRAARLAEETIARHQSRPEDVRARVELDGSMRALLAAAHIVAADGWTRDGERERVRAELERASELLAAVRDQPENLGWSRIDALLAEVWLGELAARDGRSEDLARRLEAALAVVAPLAEKAPIARDTRRAAAPRLERLWNLLESTGYGDDAARETVRRALRNLVR